MIHRLLLQEKILKMNILQAGLRIESNNSLLANLTFHESIVMSILNISVGDLNKSMKIKNFKNQLREPRKASKKHDSKKSNKPPSIEVNYRGIMDKNYKQK
jgi:hypothetical protein